MRVLQASSAAAGATNEDCAGAHGGLAWVIDGATDVIDAPLTAAPSDAAWFARFLDAELMLVARGDAGTSPGGSLDRLPDVLAERAAQAFAAAAQRSPKDRSEHPSASGLIVRASGHSLEYLSIGDCTLIAESTGGIVTVGMEPEEAGDKWLARAIAAFHEREAAATAEAARAHVWPRVRAVRSFMNLEDGYGVFSITPTPRRFVRSGSIELRAGGRALLASDGLMRLIDIFHRMDAQQLLAAAAKRGFPDLIAELRALEHEDATCRRFPRAKVSDDATGVLIEMA